MINAEGTLIDINKLPELFKQSLIFQIFDASPVFEFYLTGSWFFNTMNEKSDVDFFIHRKHQYEVEIILKYYNIPYTYLTEGKGSYYTNPSGIFADQQTTDIMRITMDNIQVDLQFVRDPIAKKKAQLLLGKTGHYKSMRDKILSALFWREAQQMVSEN